MKGKNIVITGASSGIGAILLKYLYPDNKVFAVSRNISNIAESENVKAFSCDVSKPENLDILFNEAVKYLGHIDVFFANAGFAYCERIQKPDWKHIEEIFSTNVKSVFYSLLKIKEISKGKAFKFVITASAFSYLSTPGYSLYCSTKFALKGFADAYRYELGRSQKLIMVYPVATYTEFFNVAGSKKMLWPRQKPEIVAKKMINGVMKDKKNVFPSFFFRLLLFFNQLLPLFLIYTKLKGKEFQRRYNLDININ
ncbi:MAG TPA: SDR family NAD(P)-dependent oxidoreductase [Bacteroidales bacterium]|nr:SDR family NAD(P)-dependent oxidoreductase [Bacteroidales bacterium]